jgi:hypothetical protein
LFCDEFEAQLLQVEPLTHFQIADENDDVLATISVAVMRFQGKGSYGIHPGNKKPQPFWSSLRDCVELCR